MRTGIVPIIAGKDVTGVPGPRDSNRCDEPLKEEEGCSRQASAWWLSAGGIRHRHVRRQLQLARTGLDAGECHDYSGAPEFLSLLW